MTPADFNEMTKEADAFRAKHEKELKKLVGEFRDKHQQFMQLASIMLAAKYKLFPPPMMLAFLLKDGIFANLEGLSELTKISEPVAENLMDRVEKLIREAIQPPGNN